jgi:hypothetical protein
MKRSFDDGFAAGREAAAKLADARYAIAREMRDDHGMRICTGLSVGIRALPPPTQQGDAQ